MYLTSEIIAKLEAMGVSPKKSLGQNFLVSRLAIDKIAKAVEALGPESLIEIGPGLGSLTEAILRLQLPIKLMELDRAFAQYWRDRNQEVIEGDAMKWDWNLLKNSEKTVLVSNLPYQISSSIVIERSVHEKYLKGMVLMFQKEVAERIMAKPKTEAYGLLSVIAQNFWKIELVLEAGPKDFYPPPRVASRVLSFAPRSDYEGPKKEFLKVVKAGFAQRRKFLLSNLKALGGNASDKNLRLIFDQLGLSQQVRAEELNISQWRALTQELFSKGVQS
jgi:16S rRNA (adenine1518-N6/adenine1519-N6)-dimethyltransferase